MPREPRAALIALVVISAFIAGPARALWGPDSVLAVGSAIHGTIVAGFVTTGGSDMGVVWQWSSNSGSGTSVARVTRDGGLVFSRSLGATALPGIAAEPS